MNIEEKLRKEAVDNVPPQAIHAKLIQTITEEYIDEKVEHIMYAIDWISKIEKNIEDLGRVHYINDERVVILSEDDQDLKNRQLKKIDELRNGILNALEKNDYTSLNSVLSIYFPSLK